MDRTELQQIAETCNYDTVQIRQRLEQYFETEEGQAALERAPRCMVYNGFSTGENDGLPGEKVIGQQTTKDLVISLLMQEVEAWQKQNQLRRQ